MIFNISDKAQVWDAAEKNIRNAKRKLAEDIALGCVFLILCCVYAFVCLYLCICAFL